MILLWHYFDLQISLKIWSGEFLSSQNFLVLFVFIDYVTYGHVNVGISYTEKKEVRVLLKQVSCSIVSLVWSNNGIYSIIELLGRNASFDPICFFIFYLLLSLMVTFHLAKIKSWHRGGMLGEESLSSCIYCPSALLVLAHFFPYSILKSTPKGHWKFINTYEIFSATLIVCITSLEMMGRPLISPYPIKFFDRFLKSLCNIICITLSAVLLNLSVI